MPGVPFRNTQGDSLHLEPAVSNWPLDLSKLNATKQDAASYNNQVKPIAKPAVPTP